MYLCYLVKTKYHMKQAIKYREKLIKSQIIKLLAISLADAIPSCFQKSYLNQSRSSTVIANVLSLFFVKHYI